MLRRMSIQQFRGFYSKQTFNFAMPDGSTQGSGLTIVVGPNNSGKTTFIEAITFTKHDGNSHRFLGIERHGRRAPVISITDVSNKTRRITNVNGGAQVEFQGDDLNHLQLEIVGSRRYWASEYSGNSDFNTFNNQSAKQGRNAGDPGTAALVAQINRDDTQRTQLTEMMKRLVPDFTSWTVDSREPGGDYIRYETGRGNFHAVDMLGDGIISLFRICLHLININSDTYTLIIDEPELSLHPSSQKALREILSEFAATKQIIIVTHSPLFIDWNDISSGAKVIRLNKHKDNASVVSELSPEASYMTALSGAVEQWQQPELLDVVAKEILFANNVLFLEGKEDVGLLRRWLHATGTKISFEMFGYGVGGETKMPSFLELATDLGLIKVAALFDNNATKFSACKRKYTDFHIVKLPTDDIRDKLKDDGTIKTEGIFDSSGNIKEQYEQQLKDIISDINNYFTL